MKKLFSIALVGMLLLTFSSNKKCNFLKEKGRTSGTYYTKICSK
jgi:hypothetical protein